MCSPPLKQLLSQLFRLPPSHPVYITEKKPVGSVGQETVKRTPTPRPNVKGKSMTVLKICGALLRGEHREVYCVLGTRKSRIGLKWESGKEMHFSGAAYGFLISLCKGKPGAGRAR